MATAKKAEITEISVTYQASLKANLGNFESGGAHAGKTEKWSLQGYSPEEVATLWRERYDALKAELDEIVIAEYNQMSIYADAEKGQEEDADRSDG